MGDKTARFEVDGKAGEYPVRSGSVGPDVIDSPHRGPDRVASANQPPSYGMPRRSARARTRKSGPR